MKPSARYACSGLNDRTKIHQTAVSVRW